MKIAKALWSLGCLFVNVTIIIYIYLSKSAPQDLEDRIEYVNQNWNVYSAHWKAEFLFMTMIAIGAVYFAVNLKKISWSIIVVGQLILLLVYPIMLGGYRNTPIDVSEMANQMAVVIFIFGNIVFFGGTYLLYYQDRELKKWLRMLAMTISFIGGMIFTISFVGFIDWKQALVVGPLINILYLINAYYGLKIKISD